ncbi:ExbD/TolR family protein [Montanilutibacter psychrotolerans]|nr:biopolymer transporter ExbD [Lysobacter psychrotolerans]
MFLQANASHMPEARINVVPMVAVLAALIVVVLVGGMPRTSAPLASINHHGCVSGHPGIERLELTVVADGMVRADGRNVPIADLASAVHLDPKAHDLSKAMVTIRGEGEVEYDAVMQVVNQLRGLGLRDDQLLLAPRM